MKTIIYFSLNNHVSNLVKDVPDKIRIKTVDKLPRSKFLQMLILGYKTSSNKHIAIEKIDISSYDEIDLYTPIWAGKIALPTLSFLLENDFIDKKANVFLNCEGGFGKSKAQVEEILGSSLNNISLISNKKKD